MTTTHSVLCDNCHATLEAATPYQLDYAMTSEGWHTTTEGSEYCPNCCTVEENGNLVIGLKLK